MLPWSADLAGRIDERVISSELLRGNPLGDPHERPLLVYLPPTALNFPVLYAWVSCSVACVAYWTRCFVLGA